MSNKSAKVQDMGDVAQPQVQNYLIESFDKDLVEYIMQVSVMN